MRRVILAVLLCLITLQSFAGALMPVKMASMGLAMTAIVGGEQVISHHDDCCGSPATCQNLSQAFVVPASTNPLPMIALGKIPPTAFTASFESADLAPSFKPPLL